MTAWAVAVRTCIIDDLIRRALTLGVDAVLNLGAGLDTRPYRLECSWTSRMAPEARPGLPSLRHARNASVV